MSKIRSLMAKKQEAIKTASSRKEKQAARKEYKAGVAAVKEKRAARKAGSTATKIKKADRDVTTTRSGKTVTNKKVVAKRKSNQGLITNKLRARKLAGKKTKAASERGGGVSKPAVMPTNKKVLAKKKAAAGGVTNRLRARKLAGKKTKARG